MTEKRTRETAGTAQDGREIGGLENPDGTASSTAAFAHDAALECPVPRIGEIVVPDPSTGRDAKVPVCDKGADQFAARLRKVAKERRKWAAKSGVSCYRIYDADLPDFSVAIDRYDGVRQSAGESYVVVAEYQAPKTIDPLRAQARFADVMNIVPVALGVPAEHVFAKTRRHERGGGQYVDQQKESCVAYTQEAGHVFEVDLGSYLDTGIFLDHRDTRVMVGKMAAGTRFLNLFAYTGTATVHAAAGGAKATTTVDLSQTYLAWARKNMALNGFDGPEHRFVRADVLRWIEEECMRGGVYDLIFVDPPTFSNSKAMGKSTWSVQRDHVRLLAYAVRMLAPGGTVVFSCNLRNFRPDLEGLARAGVALEDITKRTIPHDFERNPRIHCCYIATRA
ncbi:class I SAM-dependent methyltransferase [Slackia exigua]|uniref:class I SAM-dependent methyltransferase n=1 Tax=Slackia exigua TaxID=84109 RepID=UPI003AB92F3D